MTTDLQAVLQFLHGAPREIALYRVCHTYACHFDGENNLDSYTNGEYRVLLSLIPDCRIVFDVGANRGDWSETVTTINPTLEVHAFEPSRTTFAELSAKRLARVTLNNVGLGAVAEQRELYAFGADSELCSLYPRAGLEDDYGIETPTSGEPVTISTVDAYCATAGIDAIDFLKIDTEGHDLQVLRGAAGMIGRKAVRYIQFEYGAANIDSRDLLKDFFTFFDGTGYSLHKIHPDGYSHYPRYNHRVENFQYQNWLAVRPA
jgi:FkbM family methyltransferase